MYIRKKKEIIYNILSLKTKQTNKDIFHIIICIQATLRNFFEKILTSNNHLKKRRHFISIVIITLYFIYNHTLIFHSISLLKVFFSLFTQNIFYEIKAQAIEKILTSNHHLKKELYEF